jgi:hypothetical protein
MVRRAARAMTSRRWRIGTSPDDLSEGLFGQVLLWTFELLPWLEARGIQPAWDIRSRLYGDAPDFRVVPGVFDVAGDAGRASGPFREVSMVALRVAAVSVLGGDWVAAHRLWHRHFSVPQRITERADAVELSCQALGIHYRGTDKNQTPLDTNPVTVEDMLDLVAGFLRAHPAVDCFFIATDEYRFVEAARHRFPGVRQVNLGAIDFHKAAGGGAERADRALLDCVLLSRCRHVLKSSSALSGFAKVLNPELDIYRVAACKLFMDVPYFPDAYIPRLVSEEPALQVILMRQFAGDWLDATPNAQRFRAPFATQPRYSAWRIVVNASKYLLSRAVGRTRRA